MGLSENSVPLFTQWLIIIPTKWRFHWGYTPFSDIPIWLFYNHHKLLGDQAGHHRHEHPAGPLRQRWPLGCRPGAGATDEATRGRRGAGDLWKSDIAMGNPKCFMDL